jgi:ligand-binding SRPBCC domain-containing protein
MVHTFEASQFVPRPRAEVFHFFASEHNLETITPPWLNFKVLRKSTPDIQQGTLIDYRLKLYGIPFGWRTEIEAWEPGRKFVDRQLRGPYALWHHTHEFNDEANGTRMHDVVRYKLPLGAFGNLVAGWKVHRQVRDIFAYRKITIEKLFSANRAEPAVPAN